METNLKNQWVILWVVVVALVASFYVLFSLVLKAPDNVKESEKQEHAGRFVREIHKDADVSVLRDMKTGKEYLSRYGHHFIEVTKPETPNDPRPAMLPAR